MTTWAHRPSEHTVWMVYICLYFFIALNDSAFWDYKPSFSYKSQCCAFWMLSKQEGTFSQRSWRNFKSLLFWRQNNFPWVVIKWYFYSSFLVNITAFIIIRLIYSHYEIFRICKREGERSTNTVLLRSNPCYLEVTIIRPEALHSLLDCLSLPIGIDP